MFSGKYRFKRAFCSVRSTPTPSFTASVKYSSQMYIFILHVEVLMKRFGCNENDHKFKQILTFLYQKLDRLNTKLFILTVHVLVTELYF